MSANGAKWQLELPLKVVLRPFYWVGMLLLLGMILRLGFIWNVGIAAEALQNYDAGDIWYALWAGMRFDARLCAYIALAFFLIDFALQFLPDKYDQKFHWKHKMPLVYGVSALAFTGWLILLTVANIGFYKIYDDTFNTFLLGAIFDDRAAIAKTGASGNYHLTGRFLLVLAAWGVFGVGYYYGQKLLERGRRQINWRWGNYAVLLGVFYLLFSIGNSRWNFHGGSISRIVSASENRFLRKVIPGAIYDFKMVVRNYRQQSRLDSQAYLEKRPIEAILRDYFGEAAVRAATFNGQIDLAKLLRRQVGGSGPEPELKPGFHGKVKQVFFLIAESASGWHLDPKFAETGMIRPLTDFLAANQGVALPALANAQNTVEAVELVLSNLYTTALRQGNNPTVIANVPGGTAAIFKKLGYRTRFFYSGAPYWQNLENTVREFGFDEFYCDGDVTGETSHGIWGAFDHFFYASGLQKIEQNAEVPALNVLLTTANHPPYDVPLAEFDAVLPGGEAALERLYPERHRFDNCDIDTINHIYYYSKSLADFMERVKTRFPDAVVVLTGDHFDRVHPAKSRTLFESNTTLVVFWGKNVGEAKIIKPALSQIDVLPTLLELVAPQGFAYASFGSPYLSLNPQYPPPSPWVLGENGVSGDGRWVGDGETVERYGFAAMEQKPSELTKKQLQHSKDRLHWAQQISQYILQNGTKVKVSTK